MCVIYSSATNRSSNISLRLVPPAPGVDFLGRVEVLYNNTWGTVCDDGISIRSLQVAHVICRALDFDSGLCVVRASGYGPGTGNVIVMSYTGPLISTVHRHVLGGKGGL